MAVSDVIDPIGKSGVVLSIVGAVFASFIVGGVVMYGQMSAIGAQYTAIHETLIQVQADIRAVTANRYTHDDADRDKAELQRQLNGLQQAYTELSVRTTHLEQKK